MQIQKLKNNKGFTLIELMVSVSIFTVVMLICVGSIMTVLDSNRKSQASRTIMDNLSLALESMTRTVRFGSVYHCGSGTVGTQDCSPNGLSIMTVLDSTGAQVTFEKNGSGITKTVAGSVYNLTGPDVTITNLIFYVSGSTVYPDQSQPKVIVVVKGYAGKNATQTNFSLQTTLSQRKFDYQ